MTVFIRRAEPADMAAITGIYAHAVREGTASFELEPPTVEEMSRRREAVLAAGGPWLVAELAGAILGYAYAGPYRPRPAYRFTVEDSIYVGPGRQGEGVGRALLAALIRDCEARGFRQMIAVIGDSGSTASIRLHEGAGFTHVGVFREVGFKHGGWRDSVLMQRALGPGATTPPAPGA
jgi:phosphinothricin acetyltransferase